MLAGGDDINVINLTPIFVKNLLLTTLQRKMKSEYQLVGSGVTKKIGIVPVQQQFMMVHCIYFLLSSCMSLIAARKTTIKREKKKEEKFTQLPSPWN